MAFTLVNATPVETIEAAGPVTVEHHSRYWTVKGMLNLAFAAGFDTYNACIIVSIAKAESGGFDGATNWNPPTIDAPYGSLDRGILQINDWYHYEVSDSCAFDAECSFRQAYRISHNGTQYHEWASFVDDSYLAFWPDVEKQCKDKIDEEWEVDP